MTEPVALTGPQRIIRRVVAERRAGAPDHMIAEYAITEALHLLTGHDGAAADCTRCHQATARAVHDVRDLGDMTGASIVVDPEPPHRLTVRLIPHRDLAGVDQGPQPHRELQHTEDCDRLKYGQRCPFDDRDDMDDWPAEPGEYEGWYWAGRNWTDAGWEYDAGIEWQRTEDMERFRVAWDEAAGPERALTLHLDNRTATFRAKPWPAEYDADAVARETAERTAHSEESTHADQ